jgi:hypothetical protein
MRLWIRPRVGVAGHVIAAASPGLKEVINIMAALKESMQAKGRAAGRSARRMGKPSEEEKPRPSFTTTTKRIE